MKNPLTSAGIEPETFRFVPQHLNHCATAVPYHIIYKNEMKEKMIIDEKNEGIPRSRIFVDMLLIPGTVNEFPAIYRTRRFVTA